MLRREIGTPYTLNISLDSTVPNNASAATFAFTIHNEKTDEHIEVGKILTTNPSGTHGIPAGKYVCDQMPVGGGSFQECEPPPTWPAQTPSGCLSYSNSQECV